jgi:hypothetical protein
MGDTFGLLSRAATTPQYEMEKSMTDFSATKNLGIKNPLKEALTPYN